MAMTLTPQHYAHTFDDRIAALIPEAARVAAFALLGAFVERWLFFAEAKHLVMLYY